MSTQKSQPPAKRELKVSPVRERRNALIAEIERRKDQLSEAATRYLDPDRLIRVFLGLSQQTPEILDCDLPSVVAALSTCSQLGLEPGNALGLVYLIPRRIKGTLRLTVQIGFRGLMELARRSGTIARINARAVYQWEIDAGLFAYSHEPPEIRHEWSPDAPPQQDPATIVGAYAVAETADGQRAQVWLPRAEIEKRRQVGKAGDIWQSWYPEMAAKTALRYLFGRGLVSMTSEIAAAFEAEDRYAEPTPRTITPPGTYGAAVRRRMAAAAEQPEPKELPASETPLLAKLEEHAERMGATREQLREAIDTLRERGELPEAPESWSPAHGEAILRRVEEVLS